MMQLLAGPFPIQHVIDEMNVGLPYGVTTPGDPVTVESDHMVLPDHHGQAVWDDELGICSIAAVVTSEDTFGHGPNYFIIQLDGTSGARGKAYGGLALDMTDTNPYTTTLNPYGYICMVPYFEGPSIYYFDAEHGTFKDQLITQLPPVDIVNVDYPQVYCGDRLLRFSSNVVYKLAMDGSESVWSVEYTIPDIGYPEILDFDFPYCSRTADPNVVCVIHPSGRCFYYDVVTKAPAVAYQDYTRWIGANDIAFYSPRHDVFMTIDADEEEITIYANAVRPAALSNPSAVTPAIEGRVTEVSVTLTGSKNEPCAGELVGWSITAGDGALLTVQSTTNLAGTAVARYRAPLVVTTNPTVVAEVRF